MSTESEINAPYTEAEEKLIKECSAEISKIAFKYYKKSKSKLDPLIFAYEFIEFYADECVQGNDIDKRKVIGWLNEYHDVLIRNVKRMKSITEQDIREALD